MSNPADNATEKNTENKVKHQSGSFMILALIALLGTFALVSPSVVAKTLEKNVDNVYDSNDTYDIKLSSGLGFTDSDISALQYAECVEAVTAAPNEINSISQDSVIDAVNVYPELYVHVSGAKNATSLSSAYISIVNSAMDYISSRIAPAQSAARIQNIKSETKREINNLNESLAEADAEKEKLDEEKQALEEDYEKTLADMESELESINEAKAVIQGRERSAQSTIESGKQNLTSVLNEVYSKSVVTAADISRAQGLSNYVSGSEKSLHQQFTSEWSRLADLETHLHEDEIALTEATEQREQEIEEEKVLLEEEKTETEKKISELEERLDVDNGTWLIEDRTAIAEYNALAESDMNIKERYAPIGIFIYLLALAACVIIIITIITRNKSRISVWQQKGLTDHIISELFVRRISLAVALGSILGAIIGGIASPVAYMYSYADILGIPFSSLGADILMPACGIIVMVAAAALTSLLTYTFGIGGGTVGKTAPIRETAGNQNNGQSALSTNASYDAATDDNIKNADIQNDYQADTIDELP